MTLWTTRDHDLATEPEHAMAHFESPDPATCPHDMEPREDDETPGRVVYECANGCGVTPRIGEGMG